MSKVIGIGWFPKLSPSGNQTIGGAGTLALNGKSLNEPGNAPGWKDETTIMYAAPDSQGKWCYFTKTLPSGTPHKVRKPSGSALVVNGNRYAFQQGESVVYFDGTKEQTIPNASRPALTDKSFAYITPFHDAAKRLVVDGKEVHKGQHLTNLAGSGKTLAWDQSGASGYWKDGKVTILPNLPYWNRSPQPIGDKYIFSGTHPGFIIRRMDDPSKGFVFENGGQVYYPDAMLVGTRIRVVFTNDAGILSEEWIDEAQINQNLDAPIVAPPPVVVPPPPIIVPPPPPKEDMKYQLEGQELKVYQEVLKGLGAKFPEWRTSPTNEGRRKLAEVIAQTLCARLGPEWGWKSAHSNFSSPSKDASAKVLEGTPSRAKRKLAMFDMVNGSTREMNLGGNGEVGEQYFIPVPAKDWLLEATPPPVVEPPPPPPVVEPPPVVVPPPPAAEYKFTPCDCKAEVAALRLLVEELATRPYPTYEGKVLGMTLRLEPK